MRRCVCVLVYVEDPLRVLLLRRRPERAAGWQPVTGRVEPGDADLVAAALRELDEETGLGPPRAWHDLGHECTFVGYDGATYAQRTFAARFDEARAPRLSPEHEEARWVDAAEAARLLTWRENVEALELLVARLGSD